MVSIGWKKLKTRCVDGTYYVKNVQPITIGNSMIEYASEMLNGIKEVNGGGVRVLSMSGTIV